MTMLCGFASNSGNSCSLDLTRHRRVCFKAGGARHALRTVRSPATRDRHVDVHAGALHCGGLALAGGGALYAAVKGFDRASIPFLSRFENWQIVFLLVGLPGFVLTALLLLISDKSSGGRRSSRLGAFAVFAFYRREWRFAAAYRGHWRAYRDAHERVCDVAPPQRSCDRTASTSTRWGACSDRSISLRARRERSRRVSSCIAAVRTRCARCRCHMCTVLIISAARRIRLACFAPVARARVDGLRASSSPGPVTSLSSLTFQYVTPRHLRAQAIGLISMVSALFGTGLGPVLAGVLSDHLTSARQPWSMAGYHSSAGSRYC